MTRRLASAMTRCVLNTMPSVGRRKPRFFASCAEVETEACAAAKNYGVPIVIGSDAHHPDGLDYLRFGVLQARRADPLVSDRSARDRDRWDGGEPGASCPRGAASGEEG